MEIILTAQKVNEIFMDCLFRENEPTDNHIVGEGVMNKVGFHPERLKSNESKIDELLAELPEQFNKQSGGGWSFLNLVTDKNGNQWADLHQTVDELVMLSTATKKMSFLMPREMWSVLPGGMPYLVIN